MTNLPQASQIETWLTDKLVFYASNPRKNDAAVDRMIKAKCKRAEQPHNPKP
jgi:hypothetical protein